MEDIFLRDQVTGNETDREFAGYTIIDKGDKTGNQCSEQPPSSHLRAGTPRVWTLPRTYRPCRPMARLHPVSYRGMGRPARPRPHHHPGGIAMTTTPTLDDLAAALMAGAPVVALRTARGVGKSDWCIVLASRA